MTFIISFNVIYVILSSAQYYPTITGFHLSYFLTAYINFMLSYVTKKEIEETYLIFYQSYRYCIPPKSEVTVEDRSLWFFTTSDAKQESLHKEQFY